MKTLLLAAVIWLACGIAGFAATPPLQLLNQGQADEAIATLKAQTAANAGDAEAWNMLGRAYFQCERWDESISAFQRAIALRPNEGAYHMWLGRAYGEKADHSSYLTAATLARKVHSEFEKAVQLAPALTSARADLAEFYSSAPSIMGGGRDKALAQADAIANSAPGMSHWIRAKVAENDKDYDTAEREMKTAIAQSNDVARAWLNLASFYRRRNRGADAEAAVSKAVESATKRDGVLLDGAEILWRAGRNFGAAMTLAREYIDRGVHVEDAPVFRAYYLIGQIQEKQGNKSAAADAFKRALELASLFRPAEEGLKRVR